MALGHWSLTCTGWLLKKLHKILVHAVILCNLSCYNVSSNWRECILGEIDWLARTHVYLDIWNFSHVWEPLNNSWNTFEYVMSLLFGLDLNVSVMCLYCYKQRQTYFMLCIDQGQCTVVHKRRKIGRLWMNAFGLPQLYCVVAMGLAQW